MYINLRVKWKTVETLYEIGRISLHYFDHVNQDNFSHFIRVRTFLRLYLKALTLMYRAKQMVVVFLTA